MLERVEIYADLVAWGVIAANLLGALGHIVGKPRSLGAALTCAAYVYLGAAWLLSGL